MLLARWAGRAGLTASRRASTPPIRPLRLAPRRSSSAAPSSLSSSSSQPAATTAPTAATDKDDDEPVPPDFVHPMTAEEFRRAGYAAIDYVADYYARLEASADADADALASAAADGAADAAPALLLLPPPLVPVTPPPDRFPPGYLRPLLPQSCPEHPEPWDDVMRDYAGLIEPGLTHWQHPGFMAYFPGATSGPGILSEILIAATNTIGFSWAASPAATELERVAMDWLADLCGLPAERFAYGAAERGGAGGGVIQGTSSEAVLVAMLAARARAMRGRPPEDALRLVSYGTDQAHSCFAKAARIAAPEAEARVLACRAEEGYALRPEALREAVRADLQAGLIPFFAMATIGTTSSCAVDPAAEMARVLREETERFFGCSGGGGEGKSGGNGSNNNGSSSNGSSSNGSSSNGSSSNGSRDSSNNGSSSNGSPPLPFPGVWLHVDAAYAGAFAVLPEVRDEHFSAAWQVVDSYSYNPHKAGLVTFDCCAMWAADCGALRDALALTPVFLKARANELDFKDLQVPLGRRFRALKLWAVLRSYGAEGIRAHARHHSRVAAWLARRVQGDARFELAAEPRFGLVCFRLVAAPGGGGGGGGGRGDEQAEGRGDEARLRRLNQRLLARVNATGRAFIIHTVLEGRFVLRAAVGALTQQPRHVQAFWRLVQREAAFVLLEEQKVEEDAVAAAAASQGRPPRE